MYTFPRGYFWKFMVGVCRPVLQILTLFQTKKCYFPHPFSDLAFRQKLCHHYQIREETKNSSNAFRIRTFLLRSYSFGIATINTFIHSRSSLVNHTRFQTKIGKVFTQGGVYLFSDRKGPKPYPSRPQIPIWLI